jgi:hypothetical protein
VDAEWEIERRAKQRVGWRAGVETPSANPVTDDTTFSFLRRDFQWVRTIGDISQIEGVQFTAFLTT